VNGLRIERFREQKTLHHVAFELPQTGKLLDGFDAFGDDLHVEPAAEVSDRADHLGAGVFAVETGHEALVNLDDVEREVEQIAERGVARAEVVEADGDAEGTGIRKDVGDAFISAEKNRLGDLQLKECGTKAGFGEGRHDRLEKVGICELVSGDIHADRESCFELQVPGMALGGGFSKDLAPELVDQAGLFRKRDELGGADSAANGMLPAGEGFKAHD
jgi:hypothetical protein